VDELIGAHEEGRLRALICKILAEKQFANLPSCQQHFGMKFCSKLMELGAADGNPHQQCPWLWEKIEDHSKVRSSTFLEHSLSASKCYRVSAFSLALELEISWN
jgi:hypothetical protein